MESSIVKDFQDLQVLTTYDWDKMDELVQDLTNALEESSNAQNAVDRDLESPALNLHMRNRHHKKRKNRKRRSVANTVWEKGNFSEASESSLDEALKDYMENVVQQHSDSDDLIRSACRLPSLAFGNLSHAVALVESDSVTENFTPMSRPHRRRRRIGKRMAVDPQPDTDISELDGSASHEPKSMKRTLEIKNENLMDIEITRKPTSECHIDHDGHPPGKLKLGKVGETYDGSGHQINIYAYGSHSQMQQVSPTMTTESQEIGNKKTDGAKYSQESSSCASSSESDGGVFTNDDGGDGDDEQSDFFCETGPACGVQGIIPWWESEKNMEDDIPRDKNFESILTGTFDFMTPSSKRTFKARVSKLLARNREIRVARRRIKERRNAYPMSRYMNESLSLRSESSGVCWQIPNGQSGDVKRRRRTPPGTPAPNDSGYFVGGDADPIPETNIGNQMLQNMGWSPGTGLGSGGKGMTNPVLAFVRQKRKGLGTD